MSPNRFTPLLDASLPRGAKAYRVCGTLSEEIRRWISGGYKAAWSVWHGPRYVGLIAHGARGARWLWLDRGGNLTTGGSFTILKLLTDSFDQNCRTSGK